MRIRFDKIDELIMSLDVKTKHLVLFDYELLDKICDKIKYLVSKKSGIVVIIVLERSKLIHVILCLFKKKEINFS